MEQRIVQYAQGWEKIMAALKGLSEEQLAYRPDSRSWSIREIAVHLADTEIVALDRMKRIIAESEPQLRAFDQDAWSSRLHYEDADLHVHLSLFKLLRESFVPTLRRLSPEDWQRAGIHNEAGRVTLQDMLNMFVDHVDRHLGQIERVKAAYASQTTD